MSEDIRFHQGVRAALKVFGERVELLRNGCWVVRDLDEGEFLGRSEEQMVAAITESVNEVAEDMDRVERVKSCEIVNGRVESSVRVRF